ncbi:iron-sulfur cluster repair di-iron protein [Sporomusa sp.]|uniref:iron-sulfur cluster repair di-iron protein n=1 Tax=Sporomusa sp. TaxID=2078658 RepID=UPI002C087D80|nr:iron-sulfur cluster repair di-iron protein [Sporomusa sp.]HWR44897.1 iron-sulfur cluster repair di-iron protein [Sporomusa sp.]
MTNLLTGNQKVGDIVASLPEAITVFKKYNIDFCCGGHKTLSEAVKQQGVEEKAVLTELSNLSTSSSERHVHLDWRTAPLTELVNHIIDTHHTFIKKEFPIINELTEKIMSVHGSSHKELVRVDHLFRLLRKDLEAHLETEEKILFPLILEYDKSPSQQKFEKMLTVINELENEHELAGNILKELRQITNQYTAPPEGCTSYRMAYRKLEEMEDDIFRHIHLENNILHPRIAGLKLPV